MQLLVMLVMHTAGQCSGILMTACIKAVSFISTGRPQLRCILGSGLEAALEYLLKYE